MKQLLTIVACMVTASLAAQPGWQKVNHETSMVFTGIVTVNGHNAATTDLVGIFVGNECRMAVPVLMRNDTSKVSAVVHFGAANEKATIRYWDSRTNTIYNVDTTFEIVNQGELKDFPIEIKAAQTAVPTNETESIVVYPTPFINAVHARAPHTITKITVASANNQIVTEQYFNANEVVVPLSVTPSVYVVTVECNDGTTYSQKVVKQ